VIEPVLIANRGEIAVRIAATARRLGLATVAVFTPVDADAPHVDAADVAVEIGSYLDAEAVVDAARRSCARAVHPGYGFLSENAAFARAVEAAGLVWVGPPPDAIELMGDKARAKALAREAGVPVVPGVEGEDVSLEEARAFASELGYPVVVKAVAGGGGKGMRAVRDAGELEPALASARREAMAAFGDDRVLVERYLERPRHIEIQVLADAHGGVVHLGERECSLQRRHQKVIEEAPSPAADEALRARMGEAAVALARACGYAGAGTVEFITPGDASEFFFLEMNTRLQVEHPVTELVYGVDLVEQQLLVAAGEPLALSQEGLVPRGHAVEARLYAEDPANGFLPAVGTVRRYVEPPGARMDSGIREGSLVGTDYDPMLAKVIAHAEDRPTALRRLARALGELQLLGVTTNAAFSRALLEREDVRTGEIDTGLLERILAEPPPAPPEDLVPAAALAAAGTASPAGPFRLRLEDYGELRVADGHVRFGHREHRADVRAAAPANGVVSAGSTQPASGAGPSGAASRLVRVTLDGVARRYAFARDGDTLWIARDGHHLELRVARAARAGAAHGADSLEAPMPGTVLLVHAENGQEVEEGEVLVVIESMKMELSIAAPHGGTVHGLDVAVGDKVGLRQVLAEVVA
jgi:acetyl-CoA/propionyl-CoA carboxylase biotin carboxyl carrier protein